MKTIILTILGMSIVIVSCARSKDRAAAKCDQIAKYSEKEEKVEPFKRHNRW